MPAYVPNPNRGAESQPANLIEDLGAEMAARYYAEELRMIERVQRLIAAGLETPPDLVERIRIVRQLREEGEQIARDLADPAFTAKLVAIAGEEGIAAANYRLGLGADLATSSAVSGPAINAMANVALDLSNSLDKMSARITRWMPDVYQKVIADTTPGVFLGVDTFQTAQRRAATTLLERGVRGFTDDAGKQWGIGTYSEMATRTQVNRAWQGAHIATAQSVGLNIVTIVLGVDACAKCAKHAGKIYSTDGTPAGTYTLEHATEDGTVQVVVAGTLDSARAQGWNHPNCRCVVVAYLPGLSIPAGRTYDPQAERDRDRLRELERRVRDDKRKEAAAFDDITKAKYRRKARADQALIREHVAETGQMRKPYREQLGFSDGRPPSGPPKMRAIAPPAPRALTP